MTRKILRVFGGTALAMFGAGFAVLLLVQCLAFVAGLPLAGDGMAHAVVAASAMGLLAGVFVCVHLALDAFA